MSAGASANKGTVLKNTLVLVGAQLLGVPLTILINVFMGRYLGPADLGDVYLAGTLTAFGFLFVDFGHSGVLPAEVAKDRSKAGLLLGTSLLWRTLAAIAITALLTLGCWLAGYTPRFELILAIIALQMTGAALSNGCQEIVRGFERTDVSAWGKLVAQGLSALLVVPALMLGANMVAVLLTQVLVQVLVLGMVWRATRRIVPIRVQTSFAEMRALTRHGTSFLVFAFALALQGNVDALFLSKLTSPEVMGWHAAAQRLAGALTIPASALVAALYPTLSRLAVEDRAAFNDTARKSLRGTAVLAAPIALCCAFYRDVGISLYSARGFGPARNNLLILSGLLLLVYVSMPLGTTLMAAGKQRAWALAQACCVLVSLTLDPLLIPFFQTRYGNGGLGVCIGAVTSEVFMVSWALYLMPKGVLDFSVLKTVGKALLASLGFGASAYLLRNLTPFVAAPIALLSYLACLWLVGGVDREQLDSIQRALRRRFRPA